MINNLYCNIMLLLIINIFLKNIKIESKIKNIKNDR